MQTNLIIKEFLDLISHSKKCETKQIDFFSNKKILNKRTGETIDLVYDLQKEYELRYNELIFKSIYFQKEMQEKYQDKFTSLFLTLTANSQFHKYKLDKWNNLIFNPKYKNDYTPNDTYKFLDNVKRNFMKEFAKSIMVEKRYFVDMFR